jgi:hypothetical protein
MGSENLVSVCMQVFCMCPSGFLLGPDWKQCEDVDECLKVSSAMAGPKLC